MRVRYRYARIHRRRLHIFAGVLAAAAAAFFFREAEPGFDTTFALVWGEQLLRGEQPSFEVAGAPTPHPLFNALAILLTVLGEAQDEALRVTVYLGLGVIVGAAVLAAQASGGIPAAVLSALFVLSTAPIVGAVAPAYVDILYVAIVMIALVLELRTSRAGWPVLACLLGAGLLRPEAWFLACAYVIYLVVATRQRPRPLWLGLAVAGPLVWALGDLAVTGDLTHSFTWTQSYTETYNRETGLLAGPTLLVRHLVNMMSPGVMVLAAVGMMSAIRLRDRRMLTVGAAALAGGAAFLGLAAVDVSAVQRYTILPGVLIAVLAGFGVGSLPRAWDTGRQRLVAAAVSAVAGLAALAYMPGRIYDVTNLAARYSTLGAQQKDLAAVLRSAPSTCPPVTVGTARPVVALELDVDPASIRVMSQASLGTTISSGVRASSAPVHDPQPLWLRPRVTGACANGVRAT